MEKIFLLFILISISSCQKQTITNSEKERVIEELEVMRKIDQEYAGVPPKEMKEKYGDEKAWVIFKNRRDSIAIVNQIKAKKLIDKYGFIGTKAFGERASGNFWLIIQHADNNIRHQERVLKRMKKEIKNNNAIKHEYAMLDDRINVGKGKKQLFGSQVTYKENGQAIPVNGLVDSLNIEKLRSEYGLPSFKEYYNEMTLMHFEMNEQELKKRGINEPVLYN